MLPGHPHNSGGKESPFRVGNKRSGECGIVGLGENGQRRQGRLVPLQLGDTPRPPERLRRMRMGKAAEDAARAGGAEGLPGV